MISNHLSSAKIIEPSGINLAKRGLKLDRIVNNKTVSWRLTITTQHEFKCRCRSKPADWWVDVLESNTAIDTALWTDK